MDMEQRLAMAGGGSLSWRQEGSRVLLQAERPADGKGLYKVWLCRGGKDCFLLGTLMPEGGSLRLLRSVPRQELERAGCWPPEEARAAMVFAFRTDEGWHREDRPGNRFRDPVLGSSLSGPMLCRTGPEGFWLAAPYRADAPVPIPPLVCLARVGMVEGRPHWIWQFDPSGQPVLPHNGTKSGDTKDRTGDLPGKGAPTWQI